MSGKYQKVAGAGIILLVLAAGLGAVMYLGGSDSYSGTLRTFESYGELESFVSRGVGQAGGNRIYWSEFSRSYGNFPTNVVVENLGAKSEGSQDFSGTNVQVEGVDEADTVKTDGLYIYKVVNYRGGGWYYRGESGNGEDNFVAIISADNGTMDVVSSINISYNIAGIFINGDRLGIICNVWGNMTFVKDGEKNEYAGPETALYVYNISDRAEPVEAYNYTVSGSYSSSRMIGDWVYLVSNQYVYWVDENGTVPLPVVAENGEGHCIPADEIQYMDVPQPSYSYTIISAVNMTDGESDEKAFMLGESSTMYVSHSGIYLTTTNRWNIWISGGNIPGQKTSIYKFGIDGGSITHIATGDVTGFVLSQFSMDEHNGYFRIATTKEREWWRGNGSESSNNVYVLDSGMNIVGKLEGMAKGERIYSARFMGDKLYLVTFKQVDPLFVIDLSEPSSPKEVGNLKVTGASQYLHPYDEGHVIGVGFEATEGGARTGLKVSLFNVSNFTNPEEMSKYVINGSWSESSWDHHAFLFSKSRNLLVIPVETWSGSYGEEFSGAYVFNITLENGIAYSARIGHGPTGQKNETQYYYYGNAGEIYRKYISIAPGSYIDISLNCSADKEWVMDGWYDKYVIKLEDSSLSVNGGNRTYHYLFRTVGEGNTYIEMDLMGISGGQIKKYGEFRLEISSYEPYWLYQNYRITRSLYIGGVLYTLSNMMVKSNGIEDMGEIDVLDFGTDQ